MARTSNVFDPVVGGVRSSAGFGGNEGVQRHATNQVRRRTASSRLRLAALMKQARNVWRWARTDEPRTHDEANLNQSRATRADSELLHNRPPVEPSDGENGMSGDRMQRQRFEFKYRISEEWALHIREFVGSYLQIDEYGFRKPDLSYPVHSLYLDSDDLFTYWRTVNGDRNRFKLRLRFYNAHPDTPVFCETKHRMDHCIAKQRAGVHKEAVPLLLAGQLPDAKHVITKEAKAFRAIEHFCALTQMLRARPKVHVAYQREAWVDPHGDAVRVTFDRHVLGEAEPTTRFETEMTNPVRPFGNEVILELKFTNRFPNWMRDMVERFELNRGSAAKYCECVETIGEERLAHSSIQESLVRLPAAA
jgi:hypothetical protein